MRLLLILILLVAAPVGALGASWADGLCWFNYSIDGNQLAVFSIFRDSKGRNWIGSTSGLYLYDGYQSFAATCGEWQFRAQVYAMTEYGDRVFVAANDGLFILDPERNSISQANGDFPREIRSMLLIDHTLWLGSLNGLYHYDISTHTLTGPAAGLPHRAMNSQAAARAGPVYIGTYNSMSA